MQLPSRMRNRHLHPHLRLYDRPSLSPVKSGGRSSQGNHAQGDWIIVAT